MSMLGRFVSNGAEIACGRAVGDTLNQRYDPQPYQDYQKLESWSFMASK